MKWLDITEEVDSPLDDMQFADDVDSNSIAIDTAHAEEKLTKNKRGKNLKTAAAVANLAKMKARASNGENEDTINQTITNVAVNQLRIGK